MHEGDVTLVDAREDTLVDANDVAGENTQGKAPSASFVKVSGGRSSVADAFSLQAGSGKAIGTTTKQQRAARKIERWVRERAVADVLDGEESETTPSAATNAYLAYPHLRNPSRLDLPVVDDTQSFVLVDNEDGPTFVDMDEVEHLQVPSFARASPIPKALSALPRLKNRLSAVILRSPSSQDTIAPRHRRNISADIANRSGSRSPNPLAAQSSHGPAAAMGHLTVPASQPPSRGSSPDPQQKGVKSAASSFHAWAQRSPRPSVLGFFSSSSCLSMDEDLSSSTTASASAPRPSLASSRTYATSASGASRASSPQNAAVPIKSATTRTAVNLGSPSFWSLRNGGASSTDMPSIGQRTAPNSLLGPGSVPIQPIPPEHAPGRMAKALPAFLLSRRRTLVISGIRPGDLRREAGLRTWAAAQGDVARLARAPNGDVHVHYRSTAVAEQVCCFTGRVIMPGVGSVGLSWFKGRGL